MASRHGDGTDTDIDTAFDIHLDVDVDVDGGTGGGGGGDAQLLGPKVGALEPRVARNLTRRRPRAADADAFDTTTSPPRPPSPPLPGTISPPPALARPRPRPRPRSLPSPPLPSITATRSRSTAGLRASPSHRQSLQDIGAANPEISAIPARVLCTPTTRHPRLPGPAPIDGPRPCESARKKQARDADIEPATALRIERPQKAVGAPRRIPSWRPLPSLSHTRTDGVTDFERDSTPHEGLPISSRAPCRPQPPTQAVLRCETPRLRGTEQNMSGPGQVKGEDLFLQLAQSGVDGDGRPPSSGRSERVASRLSHLGNRRSVPGDLVLPASGDRRPKSSGNIISARPPSRYDAAPSDIQRHMDRYYETPSRVPLSRNEAVSVSGRSVSGRTSRYSTLPDRPPPTPSRLVDHTLSPDLPGYGRMRPSSFSTGLSQTHRTYQGETPSNAQGSQEESPADSSETKHSLPDSTSIDSDTADTVWDELDDLKSRIKKLELTGKLPTTSSARATSGDSNDRPRTATTAATTIASSPRHDRKLDGEAIPARIDAVVGGPNAANIHPLLHSALAKAKPLLNVPLYRTLEATASDALQLAAMTGSAGPQGTTFSAASIINGVTVTDRHVRRKADTMCRNLTDLCLALCEGKHEMPCAVVSPVPYEPVRSTSVALHTQTIPGRGDDVGHPGTRPVSRLEARRTSILGAQASGDICNSPRGSGDGIPPSEPESAPIQPSESRQELRRVSRASSRLLSARMPRHDEMSADENPTVRPPSRAMTDAGPVRPGKLRGQREYHSPSHDGSPSLRDALAARRANAVAHEDNRELTRVASLTSDAGRRRWTRDSTPPVLEEECDGGKLLALSQPKQRRITSLGQLDGKRGVGALDRPGSLSSSRHVVAD